MVYEQEICFCFWSGVGSPFKATFLKTIHKLVVSFVKAGGYNRRHLSFYQYLHGEAKINVVILKVFHFLEIKKKKNRNNEKFGVSLCQSVPTHNLPRIFIHATPDHWIRNVYHFSRGVPTMAARWWRNKKQPTAK